MPVLIISANPLLREVVAGTLSVAGLSVKRVEPAGAMAAVRRDVPLVIVADKALAPALLAHLSQTARPLQCCRVILVDPTCNDLVVVDLRCQSITQAADLVDAARAGPTGSSTASGALRDG
jgi:hypothetical protein